MRVAIVSPYDLGVPGGVQVHVRHLAAALGAGGDEVTVIAPGGRGADWVSVGRSRGVAFNGAVAPVALGARTVGLTRRAVRAAAPDVVHVHEPMVPWVGPAAVTAAPGLPVVATFHASSSSGRLYRVGRPLGRRLLRRVGVPVAVSPTAASYHAAALGVGVDRFAIVPNGVDAEAFGRSAPTHVEVGGGEVVLFVGRLEERKGLDVLIDAFARIAPNRPLLRLVVVGDGPERHRCEQRVPVGLRDAVVFAGRVDNDALAAWYRRAAVYVSPARGGESFGIVLLEALAAGAPVVASDLPAFRGVLAGGRCGVLVPPDDHRALAEALGRLLDAPDVRERMARIGRRRAAAHDWTRVAARLRSCYAAAMVAAGSLSRPGSDGGRVAHDPDRR